MTKRNRPIDSTERLAYRQAGHAVMATYYGIPYAHFGRTLNPPIRPVSRCSRLDEFCQLAPGKPADWKRLEKYLSFLMSGSLCDMLHTERRRGLTPQGRTQRRFRKDWYRQAWEDPDRRLDLAYLALFAWFPGEGADSVDEECQRLWNTTCVKLEYPPLWPAVEEIAERRLWNGEIIGKNAVLELISPESEPG